MTPTEVRDAINAFNKENGLKDGLRIVIMSHTSDGNPLHAAVYPNGVLGERALGVDGDDWATILEEVRTKWAEHSSIHRTRRIRDMALAIIRISAEQGGCTDAALRVDGGFTETEIRALGSEACADADQIAGNGPFSIFTIAGANAA